LTKIKKGIRVFRDVKNAIWTPQLIEKSGGNFCETCTHPNKPLKTGQNLKNAYKLLIRHDIIDLKAISTI